MKGNSTVRTYQHPVTYTLSSLDESREIGRYSDADGNQIVIESRHATLDEIGQHWKAIADDYAVFPAKYQGQDVFILKARGSSRRDNLVLRQKTHHNDGRITRVFRPQDEASWVTEFVFATVEDAKISSGDKQAVAAAWDHCNELTAAGQAAAQAIDGDENPHQWSRAAYEAACAAAGLEPADDTDIPGRCVSGSFSVPHYHAMHTAWYQLLYARNRGIETELKTGEERALAAAEEASGTGPYGRTAYEAACEAAGFTALPDDMVERVAETYYFSSFQAMRDVGLEIAVKEALGALPKTAATLASRRSSALEIERDTALSEQRAQQRVELEAAGTTFATPRQVDYIMDLLMKRREEGIGGGFFLGPTDREGVANLSTEDASTYIDSLTGNY